MPAVGLWLTVVLVAVCHALVASGTWQRWSWRVPAPVMGFGYSAAFTLALMLAPPAGKAFIYFQF